MCDCGQLMRVITGACWHLVDTRWLRALMTSSMTVSVEPSSWKTIRTLRHRLLTSLFHWLHLSCRRAHYSH